MRTCEKHNTNYTRQEVYDHPGKTQEVCLECEKERAQRLNELFAGTRQICSDKHYREIHMSAMNASKPRMFTTSILGMGPFCIEFEDGEIIQTRSEERQRQIAERVR